MTGLLPPLCYPSPLHRLHCTHPNCSLPFPSDLPPNHLHSLIINQARIFSNGNLFPPTIHHRPTHTQPISLLPTLLTPAMHLAMHMAKAAKVMLESCSSCNGEDRWERGTICWDRQLELGKVGIRRIEVVSLLLILWGEPERFKKWQRRNS